MTATAYKGKKLADMSSAERAKRVAALVKKPGTRHAVPVQYLPPELRKQRQLNARLDAPVVPGSLLSNRGLAHQREAAVTQQFGPNAIGRSTQEQADVGHWYDSYLSDVAQHSQNAQANAAAANTAIANLQAGISGTDQSAAQQAAANADAASRGATAADQSGTAANAAAVRRAILGAVGGAIAGAGQASSTYADTLAHVVAPTQKLTAQAQERAKTDDLKRQIGSFRTDYETKARQQEFDNALQTGNQAIAKASLLGNQAGQTADIDLKRGIDPVTGQPLPQDAPTGYGPGGPQQNKYGYTYDEWNALSSTARDAARKGKGKAKPKTDNPWVTPAQQGTAADKIGNAVSYANHLMRSGLNRHDAAQNLVSGQPATPANPGPQLHDPKTGKALFNPDGTPKRAPGTRAQDAIPRFDQLWASVALDLAYDGHISRANVKKLHARGIKVGPLGYPLRAGQKAAPSRPSTTAGPNGQQRPN